MEKCVLCLKAQPTFHCSCVFPALSICVNCIVPHLGAPGVHNCVPIQQDEIVPPPPATLKEVCDECNTNSAASFCLCSDPPQILCTDCQDLHLKKDSVKPHSRHPLFAYRSIAAGEISVDNFVKRQKYVSDVQSEFKRNLNHLQSSISDVGRGFDSLIQLCVEEKETALIKLKEMQEQLARYISEAAEVIEAKRYEVSYEPATQLEEMILTGYRTKPNPQLRLFQPSLTLKLKKISKSITKTMRSTIDTSIFLQNLRLPITVKDKMLVVDIPTLDVKQGTLKKDPRINYHTAFCFLDSATLLCCGYQEYRGVHKVNLNTFQVSKLKSMWEVRSRPGIFKQGNFVYVFGGCDTNCRKSAEKYNIKDNVWDRLFDCLNVGKWNCITCKHSTGVYIAGISDSDLNMTVEVFNLETEKCRLLFTYPCWFSPLAVIVKDELIIVQKDKVFKAKLGEDQPIFNTGNVAVAGDGNYWSNCLVVELHGEFFSVQYTSYNTSYVLKFKPETNELIQLKSFQPDN